MCRKIIDRIVWDFVPQKNSPQKRALKKAIKKAGNASKLAEKLGIGRQIVSRWINKICRNGQKIMHYESAKKIEKAVKIKGLAKELSKKYRNQKIQ